MTANRRMTVTVAFACALSSTVLYPLFQSSEWFYVGLGAIITVAGNAAYALDTVRGNTQPNRVSWFMWMVAPLIGASRGHRGLMDVAPSILDFLHIPAPPSFEGHSLLAANGPHAVYSESVYAHDAFGWAPLRSLRVGEYKYIEAPRPELYNLAADPHEQNNVFAKDSAKALALRGGRR